MLFASAPFFIVAKMYLTLAAPYIALASLVLSLTLLIMYMALRRRFKRLALGRTGSIEESVNVIMRELGELKSFRTELQGYLKTAERRLRGAITGVGVVRFNPFGNSSQGGNQSAAVALIDERGSGVVLSTLYSRERVAVYAKPIEESRSPFELTAEEKEALDKAGKEIAKLKNNV